ncbi:MAG: FtsX-like permease family protein [Calditrichaeota bacterium]|nr:FtsX-like permease family protein [Calditrichota bacterium]
MAWILRMAWRDSRFHRKKLLFYLSSIVLGTAALVAISSMKYNLEAAIEDQSKAILGADLVVGSRQVFPDSLKMLLDSIGGEQTQQVNFTSMVIFPKTNNTRLTSVRGMNGNFPYYGEFETVPADAYKRFQSGQYALVDRSLMIQFGAVIGDSVQVGAIRFEIIGQLNRIPGEAGASSIIGPPVYIPLDFMDKTKLLQPGSLVTYRRYIKTKSNADQIEKRINSRYDNETFVQTADERKEDLGRSLNNLYRFLNLSGFIALLLGSIGVASSIHVYLKQKLSSVAILHCLGAQKQQTFAIYMVQALAMGLIGALIGALLGTLIQSALPLVLDDFIPIDFTANISWTSMLVGLGIGLGMTVLFALLPLISVRKVSPLAILRSNYDAQTRGFDPLRYFIYFIIFLAVILFSISQSRDLLRAIAFVVFLVIAFAMLALMAKFLTWLLKRFFPVSWSFVWRQGIANLFRPNNQTLVMIVSIGLGTFLISTLYLTQNSLLEEITLNSSGNQPNLVFFDIQSDQLEGMKQIITEQNQQILQEVPIVTMRIASLNGQPVTDILEDTSRNSRGWALRREYRCTYREKLIETEEITQGEFNGQFGDSIFVSLEEGILQNLDLKLKDEIVFDVQGVQIKTYVGSVRKVDWRRVQPNFFILFPAGVLEAAPQFHVIVMKVKDEDASAQLQHAVVQVFPNISAIDFKLILKTLDTILDKIALVIRFMALFSILTGLTVLVGMVVSSRFQRIQENVLLRTLGARQKQVREILFLEYLLLGLLAASTGLALSVLSSWALAEFVFNATYIPSFLPILIILCSVGLITLTLGLFNSRGVTQRPPLDILRNEV